MYNYLMDYEDSSLAREAGFDETAHRDYYFINRDYTLTVDGCQRRYDEGDDLCYDETLLVPEEYLLPRWTYAEVADWLLRKHCLHVYAFYSYFSEGWKFCVQDLSVKSAEESEQWSEMVYENECEAFSEAVMDGIRMVIARK